MKNNDIVELGTKVDGIWTLKGYFHKFHTRYVLLQNDYNDTTTTMRYTTFLNVLHKKTSVSKVISHHLRQQRVDKNKRKF